MRIGNPAEGGVLTSLSFDGVSGGVIAPPGIFDSLAVRPARQVDCKSTIPGVSALRIQNRESVLVEMA